MMDNFAMPKAQGMFPQLRRGNLATALHPHTRLQLIAADDVGTFATAAFADPAELALAHSGVHRDRHERS